MYEYVRTTNLETMEKIMIKFSCYPKIVGERFGLGSTEFTYCYNKSYYDNLKLDCLKNHFIIGINENLTLISLDIE